MLKLRLRRAAPEALPCVLPVVEGGAVPQAFAAAVGAARFTGAVGQRVDVQDGARRLLLLGAGRPATPLDWERIGGSAVAALGEAERGALDARGLAPEHAAHLAAGAALRAFRHTRQSAPKPGLTRLDLIVDAPRAVAPHWERLAAGVRGALLARELTAEPGNHLTTRDFVRRLEALAEHGIAVDVLGRKRLARHGMGALLAVGGGSVNPPRLAVLRWRGSHAGPPIAFVGKGLCFDTGGISIKGAAGMEAMKGDMAGAAACAGAMLAFALRRSPAPAIAVLAIAENSTSERAYRPGDVLHTASGKSVEVVDTDAEGRLVLADALHYATRRAPRAIIDMATLTGSIVTALGHHRAGLFGNDAALAARLAAAGEAVGEELWPMPIGEAHRADLNSEIADLKQCCSGRLLPDASHAAAFLREFAGSTPWAHLDIAGVAQRQGAGPTGFGARLLDTLVAQSFEDAER